MKNSGSFSGFGSIDELLEQTKSQQWNTPAQTQKEVSTKNQPLDPSHVYEPTNRTEASSMAVEEKMEELRLDTLESETKAKAQMYGLEYIDLTGMPIGPDIISMVPQEEAEKHKIVSFFRLEDQIRVAVVEPDDQGINDIIANLQSRHENAHIRMYLTSQHSYDNAMKAYKGVTKVREVEYGVHITAQDLELYQQEITTYQDLERRMQEVNMTEAFAMVISMALNADSSDIHLESTKAGMAVRFRIDGILTEVARLPRNMQSRIVSRIKAIAELKLNVTDVPQDGRITIEFTGKDDTLDIRVSTLPSAFGESVVMRLLKSQSVGLGFEELGIRPLTFEKLKAEIEKPNGMIITTGPTGSGKTTTLYAILNRLNSPENKIITLENPVEYKLPGIVQSQIDHSRKYTFDLGLRAILRQDPDIVMVGEIRDLETATTAIEASLTGHLMLSTIHTNDAAGVVPRLLGMGVDAALLAPALNAVIGQRLVRRICDQCKQPYTPGHEELTTMKEWIANIPESSGEQKPDVDSLTLYKGVGCTECGQSGYKGRVGVYEVFTMSAAIEQQILSNTVSEFEMTKLLHDAGMVTMGQDGMLKVADGLTTIEEVMRVAKA